MQQLHSTLSYSTQDLVHASKQHVAHLQGLYQLGVVTSPPLLQSLIRYEYFWLPLVAAHSEKEEPTPLIPPPDIAWLWHCHRLAPNHYESYSRSMYAGQLIEAIPPFAFQAIQDDQDFTQHAWKLGYPNDPFFLEVPEGDAANQAPTTYMIGSHDLVASTKSQSTFLWQVSGYHFQDDAFLEDAVQRYDQFLHVTDHALPLVPTFQIDLMWHTHMLLSTDRYNQDCINIRGALFHHDDSITDRTPGSALDQAFDATIQLWEDTYEVPYHVDGGMYRGEPPASYWAVDWQPACAIEQAETSLVTCGPNGATSAGTNESEPAYFYRARIFGDNNPVMSGYVFGSGSKGLGYYSLLESSPYIQDAYTILVLRLSKRIHAKQGELGRLLALHCHSLGGQLDPIHQEKYAQIAGEVLTMEKMIGHIQVAAKQRRTPPAVSAMGDLPTTDHSLQFSSPWYTNYAQAAACGGAPAGGGCGGGGAFGGWG